MASEAVYFASSDYAGFWRRVLVEVADVFTVAILLVLVAVILSSVLAEAGLLLCWAATIYWYFVIMKHSRLRTIGYRLGRVRIVDAYGQPLSHWALSLRLLFAVVGPLNLVLDMLWIPSDPCKQSLRDKLAHSYVVKESAQAAGRARVIYRNYFILGMAFVFQEIEPQAPSSAS